MSDLIRMDLFKLKKSVFFIAICITVLAITFIAPLLIKGFVELLKNMLSTSGELDPATSNELMRMTEEISLPVDFSAVLRSPLGGTQLVTIPVMIFLVSFMHQDLNMGYIKNLAGQVPNRGYLAVSKYIVICLAEIVLFILGIAGSTLGNLISRGVSFDGNIGSGSLEFLLKLLLLWGLTAVLLLISTGLGNKVLAIVAAVIFSTGALSIIYMPLSYVMQQLFKNENIHIEQYAPDQMFLASDINAAAAGIEAAVLIAAGLFGTVRLMNRRDIK